MASANQVNWLHRDSVYFFKLTVDEQHLRCTLYRPNKVVLRCMQTLKPCKRSDHDKQLRELEEAFAKLEEAKQHCNLLIEFETQISDMEVAQAKDKRDQAQQWLVQNEHSSVQGRIAELQAKLAQMEDRQASDRQVRKRIMERCKKA